MNIPELLGHYRIEAHLGDGRVTRTFRAFDTIRRRPVALKLLPPDLVTTTLLQEARLAADLVHPHIAWVWEADQIGGQDFLAERWINGQPLRRLMAATGPVAWEQALEIASQIAEALDFAQRKGWSHGDVCPDNILFSPEQGAVLSDFGLSRLLLKRRPPWPAAALSPTGTPVLRPEYAAPELWQGQPPSSASDQYALACTTIELLTGQPLFSTAHPAVLSEQHLAGIQLPPDGWGVVPQAALSTLQRALALQPEERFASAEEFAVTLQRQFQEAARREAAAWRAAAAERQRLAEEAERQRALEEARREVFAQAKRYAALEEAPVSPAPASSQPEALQPEQELSTASPAPPPVAAPPSPLARADRRQQSRVTGLHLPTWERSRWLLLAVLFLLAVGLVIGAIWLLQGSGAPGGLIPASVAPATATLNQSAPAIPTATAQPTATASSTPTLTSTFTALPSPTPSATPTPTPTSTPTPTPAPSATTTFTPTPIRPERETQPPRPFPFPTSRP